jgi:hypothetical protein
MNYQSKVKSLALTLGAEIEKVPTKEGWQIEVAAPDGKTWNDGPSVLLAQYGGTYGNAVSAWADIHERMQYGLN